jgi:glutaredoxin 3
MGQPLAIVAMDTQFLHKHRHQIKETRMKPVEIYTSPLCGYCHAAKRLLNQKGVTYAEVNVLEQPERKAEMIQRANGGRTVPQIFIGEAHVGGCDDLFALEQAGKLDPLLSA